MEHEKLQPIDLEVLEELYKKAYLPKTADEISKKLNIDYTNTLKIFTRLEKKGLCVQQVVNKKRECDKKDNYFKVAYLNDLGKDLCAYLKALEAAKNHKKDQNNDRL
ncbi:hypothetical protein COL447_11140 [Helicobacter pylori]|uniref:winged helix-turn-helix domain-containing protein n=1 Tax=Helicobacter pylori TaxID=210 RepID=UPI000991F7F5|nr:winged helix-turn-helix domain-containing protein [Helicobacter pylori]OOP97662.1 hypothetical protein B0X36_01785 [Helicobacter pylori]PDX10213.1 hypothetical protein BB407_04710 [Helicobacter pylori]